ncbi:MAG: hypothetical protein WC977_05080 [Anaerovoracaceae bacterium]
MFCEECGSPLKEGDKSCRVCGVSISGTVEEADNIPDNQEHIEPKILDEQTLQAEPGSFVVEEEPIEENETKESKAKETDDAEFDWNLNGFPKPRKTEDIDFDWKIEDTEASDNNASLPLDEAGTVEVAEEPSDLTQELNKYFTFDRAREDFQKLLDREYDRIKEHSPPPGNPYIENMNLANRIDMNAISGLAPEFESAESGSQPERKESQSETEPVPEVETVEGIETKDPEQTPVAVIAEEDALENDMFEEEEPEVIWVSSSEESLEVSEPAPDPEPDPDPESEPKTELGPEPTEELAPLWFDTKEEGVETERKRGGYIGKAILTLIIIALLAEATILGIQYFMPGSTAAEQAKAINSAVSETLVEWKDSAVGAIKRFGADEEVDSEGVTEPTEPEDPDTEGPDQGDKEVPEPEPDPTPVADKETLIAAVSDRNENIAAIKANDSLAWKSGAKYAEADIASSKPLENNHWTTLPNGEHVYYDKEIVATLVGFDSKWIDYVNGGSDAVIDLTKEGSQARKNAVSFSKVGKVEQTFRLLEIGEIRQGENAFYAWTYEEIEEVQGSKSTIKKYNWIYQLEPVDGEMKIVRYYDY